MQCNAQGNWYDLKFVLRAFQICIFLFLCISNSVPHLFKDFKRFKYSYELKLLGIN